jgi:hypothetical protein
MLCPKIDHCRYFENPERICFHAKPHKENTYTCTSSACNCLCEEYEEFLKTEDFEI